MATNAENIATIKSNTLAMLATMSEAPKLNYSENGRSWSWTDYQLMLQKRVEWCNQQLAAEEPFEVESYGYLE
jgi:hypothetical protein